MKTTIKRAKGPLGSLLVLLAGGLSAAFPVVSTAESADMEEVIVTGTRITRRDFDATSPISTIDDLQLDFAAQPTLEETLNRMPQVQPAFARTSNSPGDGTAQVNLRGLGADRTLVMMNGRRLAPSGAASAVDINNIPQALIERIEIITGGASAVYGSDAVAGVVNVITKDDYEGFSVGGSYYSTEVGDSETADLNVLYGFPFANSQGSFMVYGTYLEREESFAADRAISQVPLTDNLDGTVSEQGSSAVPGGFVFAPNVDLGNGPVLTRFNDAGDLVEFIRPDDLYNYAPINYLQTPLTRYAAGAFISYALNDRIEAYTELAFTRNEAGRNLAPIPTAAGYIVNLDNPFLTDQVRDIASTQFFPAGPGLFQFGARRRWEELGAREIENNRDYLRVVAGLRGSLNDVWDFDAWVIVTDAEEDEVLNNSASASRIDQGLLVDPATGECFDPSNGCVPINIFGPGNVSAEAADFIRIVGLVNQTSREQTAFSAFVTGAPFYAPAGPVDLAFGIEARKDKIAFKADDGLFSGDAVGYLADSSISGEETVAEVYGEAVIPVLTDLPLIQRFDIEVGARYSDYDNAGSVDTWKIGGQWQLSDTVGVRSIYQRSVRAPNLAEAFQEQRIQETQIIGNDTRNDPCSATANPVANGNADKCVLQGIPQDQLGIYDATPFTLVNSIRGGNPNLTPETADTLTVGLLLTPTPALSIGLDYFDLEVEDTIGEIDPLEICFDPSNSGNLFCNNIRRDPVTFNIVELSESVSNRGISAVRGIDTQVEYSSTVPFGIGGAGADLRLGLVWTHLLSKEDQENPVSTVLECEGKFGFPCGFGNSVTFPSDRVTANMRYTSGDLDANLALRWIAGSDNAAPGGLANFGIFDPILSVPEIGAETYVDIGMSYQFTSQFSARLAIINVTDEQPPFMADWVFQNNTDTLMYDIFGRSYRLGFTFEL